MMHPAASLEKGLVGWIKIMFSQPTRSGKRAAAFGWSDACCVTARRKSSRWMGLSMTERGNDGQRISRRAVLTRTALALGGATAAAVVRQAAAQRKIPQAFAKYQNMPNGNDHCEVCNNFQPPNACKFVEGEISPKGWCQLFSPKT
jgi:hypothetical protein